MINKNKYPLSVFKTKYIKYTIIFLSFSSILLLNFMYFFVRNEYVIQRDIYVYISMAEQFVLFYSQEITFQEFSEIPLLRRFTFPFVISIIHYLFGIDYLYIGIFVSFTSGIGSLLVLIRIYNNISFEEESRKNQLFFILIVITSPIFSRLLINPVPDMLCFFFLTLSQYYLLLFENKNKRFHEIISIIFFILAVITKEQVVIFYFVYFFLDQELLGKLKYFFILIFGGFIMFQTDIINKYLNGLGLPYYIKGKISSWFVKFIEQFFEYFVLKLQNQTFLLSLFISLIPLIPYLIVSISLFQEKQCNNISFFNNWMIIYSVILVILWPVRFVYRYWLPIFYIPNFVIMGKIPEKKTCSILNFEFDSKILIVSLIIFNVSYILVSIIFLFIPELFFLSY